MYYHASQKKDIKVLEPRISNHGKSFIYFSLKRENVLVYLSNSIEKFCKETGFKHDDIYTTWGPYGFGNDGILELEEYYPNAFYETYKGVSGYIYHVKEISNLSKLPDIPYVYTTTDSIKIDFVEYIEDAYEEILKASKEGKIRITLYDDLTKEKREWIKRTIEKEYDESTSKKDYRYFLENKFLFLNKTNNREMKR